MNPIAAARALVSSVLRLPSWLRREEVRLVRRVGIECPHGRGFVEVDLLTDRLGKPECVLRCSAHKSCPPTCDQSCRTCAEAVLTPTRAMLILSSAGARPGDPD
jgi:hypothetical protein